MQPHRSKLMEGRESSLTLAVKEGHPGRVTFLLAAGLNGNEIDVTGVSPLFRAIRENRFQVVQAFAQNRNTDIRNFKDESGHSPLIAAIKSDVSIDIIKCLLERGADINEKQNVKTPLAWASQVGNLQTVKFLIENGADVNLTGLNGNTPLGTAIEYNRSEVAKFLLAHNADLNKFDDCEDGKSPLYWAILNENMDMFTWLLDNGAHISHGLFLAAIETRSLELVQTLIDRGARVTRQEGDFEETPLQRAVEVSSVAVVELLLENGARVVEDLYHQEIARLFDVLRFGNLLLAKVLVENGARINEMGPTGDTLLTRAIKDGQLELVKYLITHGADPNRPNSRGMTPLALAEYQPDCRFFQHLVLSGASVSEADRRLSATLMMNFEIAQQQIMMMMNQCP